MIFDFWNQKRKTSGGSRSCCVFLLDNDTSYLAWVDMILGKELRMSWMKVS